MPWSKRTTTKDLYKLPKHYQLLDSVCWLVFFFAVYCNDLYYFTFNENMKFEQSLLLFNSNDLQKFQKSFFFFFNFIFILFQIRFFFSSFEYLVFDSTKSILEYWKRFPCTMVTCYRRVWSRFWCSYFEHVACNAKRAMARNLAPFYMHSISISVSFIGWRLSHQTFICSWFRTFQSVLGARSPFILAT